MSGADGAFLPPGLVSYVPPPAARRLAETGGAVEVPSHDDSPIEA